MAKRRKSRPVYTYNCSISGEEFKTFRQIADTDNLVSVKSYYELNPESDDRPEHIMARLKVESEPIPTNSTWDKLVELAIKQKEEREAQEATASHNTSSAPNHRGRRR